MSHKEDLLEGAIACIQERGYARTTARDIVAASGSNLGAIGYHYGSKEALLNAAVLEGFRRWLDPLIASCCAGPAGGDAWQRLESGLDGFFASLGRHRHLVVGFFEAMAQAERDESLRRQLADGLEELRSALAVSVQTALASDDAATARTLATLLMAVADGLMTQWLLEPEHAPDAAELLRSTGTALATLTATRG